MAKVKSKWICQQCGYESAGYLGKCPECGSWSSFVEEIQNNLKPQNISPDKVVEQTIISRQKSQYKNFLSVYLHC